MNHDAIVSLKRVSSKLLDLETSHDPELKTPADPMSVLVTVMREVDALRGQIDREIGQMEDEDAGALEDMFRAFHGGER